MLMCFGHVAKTSNIVSYIVNSFFSFIALVSECCVAVCVCMQYAICMQRMSNIMTSLREIAPAR